MTQRYSYDLLCFYRTKPISLRSFHLMEKLYYVTYYVMFIMSCLTLYGKCHIFLVNACKQNKYPFMDNEYEI